MVHPSPGRRVDALLVLLATAVVIMASAGMEQSAAALGRRLTVPGIVVGSLVLAAVTSLPNAIAAVYLARRGRGAAVLSTALNSNTLNITVALLLPATLLGLTQFPDSPLFGAACCTILTAPALVVAYKGRGLGRVAGIGIIATYLVYAAMLGLRIGPT